jgi:hypothetical protein
MRDHGFSISSCKPVSADGEFSLVFPVQYRRSGSYVGKVLRWSFVPHLSLQQFREELERQFDFAYNLNGEGFSVPIHYGVFDMLVPLVGRNLPVLVEQRIRVVPRKKLPQEEFLRALHGAIDERMLAEAQGFTPGCDFYSNLLYSKDDKRFMIVDFAYWKRRV